MRRRRLVSGPFCVVLLLWSWPLEVLAQEAAQEVRLEVAVPPGMVVQRLEARATWLGEPRTVRLVDGGGVPGDEPGDGLWTARMSGRQLRLLPLTLWFQAAGGAAMTHVHGSLEPLSPGIQTLTLALEDGTHGPTARRLSMRGTVDQVQRKEAALVGLSLGWALLLLLLLGWLQHRRGHPGPALPDRAWATFLVWLALAVAWTWPAAAAGPQVAGRHFDVLGVIWFVDHAARVLQGGVDHHIAFPQGIRYENFDSYTLVLLARVVPWLDPARLHGWLQLLGVATSAWAAERFARAAGARAPWTMLAGLSYAFSGLAASALVEGHVYFLLNPWMPLFGWAWWRATGPGGRGLHGVAAGLMFVLVLLTSAYLAVAAAVLAVGFFVAGALRRPFDIPGVLRPGLGALAVVLPASALYLVLLLGNIGATGTAANVEAVPLMSASLARLAAATPELDRGGHSLALGLSGVMLALAIWAPMLLRRRERWRTLAWTGAVALLLCMGPLLVAGRDPTAMPLPYMLLLKLPVGDFLRFPIRLAWGALLCGGVLAALAGTALERRCGRTSRVLVLLALAEVFLLARMPWRQTALPASSPAVYRAARGPVLDLLPQGLSTADDLNFWFWATACYQQTHHHQPLAEDCVTTRITESPRYVLGAWLTARLLAGQAAAARRQLRQMGFAGVMFYPDLFHAGDRRRLRHGLATLDPSPGSSTDGGQHVQLFRLTPRAGTRRGAQLHGKLAPPTPASIGAGAAIPRLQTLRVELLGEVRVPGVSYQVQLLRQGRSLARLQLHNRVEPGSTALDTIWYGTLRRGLPGAVQLRLIRRAGEQQTVLWSGPVRFSVRHERLVYRLVPSADDRQPTRAWPVAVVPVTPSPPADAHNGAVAAAGWGLYATLAGGLLLWGWRRRRREQAAP